MALIERQQQFLGQQLTLVSDDQLTDPFSRWLRRPGWKPEDHTIVAALLTSDEDLVIDLGANYGTFFLPVCLHSGARCIAVEALRANIDVLDHALDVNNMRERATLVHAAVTGQRGKVQISGSSAYGTVGDNGEFVNAITLNDLASDFDLSALTLVKMDIEGCEMEALQAADYFFDTNPNVNFLFEANAAHSLNKNHLPQALLEFFERRGYQIYLIRNGRCVRRTSSDFQEAGVSDYLATKTPLDPSLLHGFDFTEFSDDEIFEKALFSMTEMKTGYRKSAKQQMHLAPEWLTSRLASHL